MTSSKLVLGVALFLVSGLLAVGFAQEKTPVADVTGREFYIKKTEPRMVATMMHKGPFSEIPTVIAKLQAEVEKGKHHVAGPVMVLFHTPAEGTPEKEREWEVIIPVVKPGQIGGSGYDKVLFRFMDSGNVVYCYHIGARDKINDTYVKAFDWIKKMGYEVKGFPMEIYWNEPTLISGEHLVTEVWIPIKEERQIRAVK